MLTVRTMIFDLARWLQTNRTDIQHYIDRYPYVQYREMQIGSALKNKVSAIVSQIATVVSATRVAALQRNDWSVEGGIGAEGVNILFKIKTMLDDIKYALLGVQDLSRLNITQIQMQLQKSLELTAASTLSYQNAQKISPLRNRSQQNNKLINSRGLSDGNVEQKGYEFDQNKQKDKTALFRAQLYREMNTFLQQKEKNTKQRNRRRIFSGRLSPSPLKRENQRLHNYNSVQINEDKNGWLQNSPKASPQETPKQYNSVKNKKKFNYLQVYEDAVKRIHKQIQIEDLNITPLKIFKHRSPPSTNQTSQQRYNYEDKLEAELSQFTHHNQHLPIEKPINFQSLLDKLKEEQSTNNEREQLTWNDPLSKWQKFQEDSIDGQKAADNLQDSLQMMKAEQGLNNTGYFGVKTSHIPKQIHHQYSFSAE